MTWKRHPSWDLHVWDLTGSLSAYLSRKPDGTITLYLHGDRGAVHTTTTYEIPADSFLAALTTTPEQDTP